MSAGYYGGVLFGVLLLIPIDPTLAVIFVIACIAPKKLATDTYQ